MTPRMRLAAGRNLALARVGMRSMSSSSAKYTGEVLPERSNKHVLDTYTVKEWTEIPKGGFHGSDARKATWSIWYNHAVVPLYVVIVVATSAMSWFLYRYFSKHTEIAWSKEVRAQYDHQGVSDVRAVAYTNRLMYPGVMQYNKKHIRVFPFNYEPMQAIRERHTVTNQEDPE